MFLKKFFFILIVYFIIIFILFTFKIKYFDIQTKKITAYSDCNIENCFNINKCIGKNLKIYVYKEPNIVKSEIFSKILFYFRNSKYYTDKPEEACFFLPSIDSINQDRLARDYLKNISEKFNSLEFWNDGKNHLIFNLYSGHFPHYNEKKKFFFEKSIIIGASASKKKYRKDFDVSFPLFELDFFKKKENYSINENLFGKKRYLLSFKGKRYLKGISSNLRKNIRNIGNKKDILILTTCRHLNWLSLKMNSVNRMN